MQPAMAGFFMERLVVVGNEDERMLQDKCGIIGLSYPDWMMDSKGEAAPSMVRNALVALQHRGQDSAGFTALNGDMKTYHGIGLINQAIPDEDLVKAGGSRRAIGHTRYRTKGSISGENSQPIQVQNNDYVLSLAHNGNLTNVNWLRDNTEQVFSEDASDTVLLTAYLLQQRHLYPSWETTFQEEMPRVKGAYSAVALTEDGNLHGFRDPYGIRPFVVGAFREGGVMMASESVAFDTVGAEYRRQLERGEIMTVTPDGDIQSLFYGEPKRSRFCTFENFYFQRPETFSNGQRVQAGRVESGRLLAERMESKNINFDIVVPTPASGSLAGEGLAERSGKRLVHGVGTSHYLGRTFIMPGEENRKDAVSNKHIIMPDELDDMSVADEDDSTVRGTTSGKITEELRRGGAREVHKALAAPPVVNTCDLGVDMHDRSELPAAKVADRSHEEIENYMAQVMHSDTATFLTREEVSRAFNRDEKDMCTFCLGGEHPVHGRQEEFPQRERQMRGRPKLSVFISGNGTNLQEIINGTQSGTLNGEIVSVVSSNPYAFGLRRAMEAELPIFSISSKGKLNNPLKRAEYEEKLLDVLYSNLPDVLVLAGFMNILGDSFLETMQDLEIPVVNLHPALLPSDKRDQIATSRGRMPVLRGTDAIDKAFDLNLRASGVTVHQVLPGNECDTGPVILKEEVHRRVDDTPEEWEKRIHEAEFRVLPTAIKRVLHVMEHGIDVSRGEFPWS